MPPKSKDTPPAEPTVEPAAGPAVGTWSVAEPADAEPAAPAAPFLSEGIRQELEQFGRAGDPVTGGKFERDKETGQVTYTDRAGNVTEL